MMDNQVAAATAASAAATASWITGQPPDAVVIWALVGGVISVWRDPPPGEITFGWVLLALGQLLLSLAVGLIGAASIPAVAAGYAALQPISAMPQWAISGLCSLMAPAIVAAGRSWLERAQTRASTPQGGK